MVPALMFFVASQVGSLSFPPAGTYRYAVTVSGKRAGASKITVRNDGTTIRVSEGADAHLDTGDQRISSETSLNSQLQPLSYVATYQVLDQSAKATVEIAGRTASIKMGTDAHSVELGGSSKAFIILDTAAVSGFFALPAQMRAFSNADATVIIPGSGGSAFLSVIPDDHPARPNDVPSGDGSISFAGDAPFVEWFNPSTMVPDEIIAPGQNLIIRRL